MHEHTHNHAGDYQECQRNQKSDDETVETSMTLAFCRWYVNLCEQW